MDDLPQRKKLRLKNYDYSNVGYYFVTICTYNRQQLFELSTVGNDLCVVPSNTLPNMIIEKWLTELQNKYETEIDKYIIMPDHIHFIVVISAKQHEKYPLQNMMQWFKTMTTNEYIKLVKNDVLQPFDTKLWQKSYYEHIIRDDEEYTETVQYILNNPIKWRSEKDDNNV